MSTSMFEIAAGASRPQNGLATTGPKYVGSGITVELVLVTPEMAKAWLATNHGNRRVRTKRVEWLAGKMRAGKFSVNHEGLAFDEDRRLIDGQHRLAAIAASGVAVWLIVVCGIHRASAMDMDSGGVRTLGDVSAYLANESNGFVAGDDKDFAVAKAMGRSIGARIGIAPSDREFWLAYFSRHSDAIAFSKPLFADIFRNSVFRAVAARAWYTRDRERIAEFGRIVSDGYRETEADDAAVAIRNIYMAERGTFGSPVMSAVLYRKLETALTAFLERRPLRIVRECKAEMFPIPGDNT